MSVHRRPAYRRRVQDPRDGSRRRREESVHTITTAADARSRDLDARVHRYLVSMGIRSVCFVLAILVDGWLRWGFIAGAIVLPYVAVIFANAPSINRGGGAPQPDTKVQSLTTSAMGTLPRTEAGPPRTPGRGDPANGGS